MRTDYKHGISAKNRELLSTLARAGKGAVSATDASEMWGIDKSVARRKLGYLARAGWLARVKQGLYVPVPIEAKSPATWQGDAWVVASKALDPCYIGGWTACEFWGLTDQIFRDIVVFTSRRLRGRQIQVQNVSIRAVVVDTDKLFGLVQRWREASQVRLSDPSRTLVDVVGRPELGGGIRHVAEVVGNYLASEHRDDRVLVEYGIRAGNRTFFKRLGYLIEELAVPADTLLGECRAQMSKGISKLDPKGGDSGPIVTRWRLKINAYIGAGE